MQRGESEERLFEPSLDQHRARADAPRVWRLGSQFYVSFFGGPIAAAIVGFLNGRRLGLGGTRLALIAAIGAAGLVAAATLAVVLEDDSSPSPRVAVVGAGVVSYLAIRELQKDADRRFRAGRSDDEVYASLWVPGLVIVVVSFIVTALALAPVIA